MKIVLEESALNRHEYAQWIEGIRSTIRRARNRAALSVDSRLQELYWNIGKAGKN